MTEVAVNNDINITEITANMEAEGFQAAEVEAVVKAAGDDTIWNAMEGFKGMDVSDEDLLVTAIGAGQNNMMAGGLNRDLVPKPKLVKPTDPHVIKIGQFAVKKRNEQAGTKLVFIKVIAGIKWNVVAGTFYALIIETQDRMGTHHNKALVCEAKTGHKRLIWYKN